MSTYILFIKPMVGRETMWPAEKEELKRNYETNLKKDMNVK